MSTLVRRPSLEPLAVGDELAQTQRNSSTDRVQASIYVDAGGIGARRMAPSSGSGQRAMRGTSKLPASAETSQDIGGRNR